MVFNWGANFKRSAKRAFVLFPAVFLCLLFFVPRVCFSIDVIETLRFSDRWPDASVNNIASGGGNLFFANGNFLVILGTDLSETARIQVDAASGITGIAADPERDLVYAACGPQGIAIIDVSAPANPTVTSTLENISEQETIHASAVDYDTDTRRLYVADVFYGLRCINVSDPAAPSPAWGYAQTTDYPQGSDYTGGHINVRIGSTDTDNTLAFVLDQLYGLRVFDVDPDTAPLDPLVSFDMRSRLYFGQFSEVADVAVNWPHAYVSDLSYGVTILNIQTLIDTPGADQVGQIETPGTASGLALSGDNNTLFVADGNQGLLAADVTNPEAALENGDSLDFPSDRVQESVCTAAGAYSVLHAGSSVYLASGEDGLTRLRDSDYGRDNLYNYPPSDTTAVYADGEYAYILDNDPTNANGDDEGLRVIKLAGADTGRPELAGFVPTEGSASAVAVYESFAYVADGTRGVAQIDVSDKTAPASPTYSITGGNARDIKIWAENGSATAYIADSSSGLMIAGVESNGQLTTLGTYPVNCRAVDVYEHIEDDVTTRYAAIITTGSPELEIVDVTNSANPNPRGSLADPTDARDVALTGLYGSLFAVVADGAAGIRLVDITNPDAPAQIGRFDTEGTAEAVSLYASYIHAALGARGTAVVGISDANPATLNPIDIDPDEDTDSPYYNTPGYASDVFIAESGANRYTYIADDHGGFLSLLHDDQLSEGINEQPFTESPDDTGCFISSLF